MIFSRWRVPPSPKMAASFTLLQLTLIRTLMGSKATCVLTPVVKTEKICSTSKQSCESGAQNRIINFLPFASHTAKTLYRKFYSRNGTARSQSQFLHSFFCVQFIYAHNLPILLHEIGGPMVDIYKSLTDTWMWTGHTVKKRFTIFPSPAGMSLTKLSLVVNNFIFPGQGEFG